jgi:adenine-specific DNA-methyltransferase
LRCNAELSVGEESGNLLVQGDNLLALKALLPYYAGQVKCIYIDPPYNTGNESWVYNDRVNSPEMREWLGRVVGGDSEDLSRHDKWLCMMYPRLVLLREMLREDGSIWISIDDNEVHNARSILDEIFGSKNFITTVIWQKIFAPKGSARHLSTNHDYILVYTKNEAKWTRNLQVRSQKQDDRYKNPDNDPRGVWASDNLTARNYYSLGTYPITTPSGRLIEGPTKGTFWRVSKDTFEQLDKDNRIWWGEKGSNMPRLKRFLSEVQKGIVPQTIWFHEEVGNTQEAKKEVVKIIPDGVDVFSTPKPTRLLKRILEIASNPGDIILDAFAGSGTTGDVVLQMNNKNEKKRHFVLIEIDSDITKKITAERLQRVAKGYEWRDQKGNLRHEEGFGGGFRFCELGPTLFDADGQIRTEVAFLDLARHVFFTETGQPLTEADAPSPLLGTANGSAIYLLYNGIMRDAGNVLTPETLECLPPFDGLKVIYGDGCKISRERLREMGITFKQIPYEVKVR